MLYDVIFYEYCDKNDPQKVVFWVVFFVFTTFLMLFLHTKCKQNANKVLNISILQIKQMKTA